MKKLIVISYMHDNSVNTGILNETQLINYFENFDNSDIPEDCPVMPAFSIWGMMALEEDEAKIYQVTLPEVTVIPFSPHDPEVFDQAVNAVLDLLQDQLEEIREDEDTNTQLESYTEGLGDTPSDC